MTFRVLSCVELAYAQFSCWRFETKLFLDLFRFILVSLKRANVVLFSYDKDDVELGVSVKEKGKIDSKVGTTNNDNDFVKFKVHEYNQLPWESFFSRYNDLAGDSLSFLYASRWSLTVVRDFIIANATISNGCEILFVPIFDQSRIHFTLCTINFETLEIYYYDSFLWMLRTTFMMHFKKYVKP